MRLFPRIVLLGASALFLLPVARADEAKILTNQVGYNADRSEARCDSWQRSGPIHRMHAERCPRSSQSAGYSRTARRSRQEMARLGFLDHRLRLVFHRGQLLSRLHFRRPFDPLLPLRHSAPSSRTQHPLRRDLFLQGGAQHRPMDKADRHLPFDGKKTGTVDAHGGWWDATGDYGKHLSHLSFSTYFNPQQIPLVVYSFFKSNELLNARAVPGSDSLSGSHARRSHVWRGLSCPRESSRWFLLSFHLHRWPEASS